MEVKIYVPTVVEIPSEYLPALTQRANAALDGNKSEVFATRGHLVRQAVNDGLLRDLDSLKGEDGTVDMFCDPQGEIPLEIDNSTVTLAELLETLQSKKSGQIVSQGTQPAPANDKHNGVIPMQRAA